MFIQCTKKLLDQLNLKPRTASEENPLLAWHANLITLNRRKSIVLMNDSNQYVLVLYGLKAKDFKNLDRLIVEAIRETFQAEHIRTEIVEQYIGQSPEFIYTKTQSRSLVARLNKACANVEFYAGRTELDGEKINQPDLSLWASSSLVGGGNGDYIEPYQALYKDLERFSHEPVIDGPAVQLKATLDLDHHLVWRRLVVPAHTSFRSLHNILQRAFGWQDYHLHNFLILEDDTPIADLVCSEESFEYEQDIPMILETGKKLSNYIPGCSKIIYTYDFGDNWEHTLEVEEVIPSYKQSHPECLAGEGSTPPEDVGGEGGYDEFLKAISDPRHPEHQDMVEWGRMQNYSDFDINMVNWKLKRLR